MIICTVIATPPKIGGSRHAARAARAGGGVSPAARRRPHLPQLVSYTPVTGALAHRNSMGMKGVTISKWHTQACSADELT